MFDNNEVIPTGLKHGTVTIVIDKKAYEVTTYRIDGEYSDNRRPDSVTFTSDLRIDLARRDLTINAIAYNPKVGFIDEFNGLKDIDNEIVRCVGKPRDRFNEDALRILRAIRFSAQLGFKMDRETELAIHRQCKLVENIAIERVRSELYKIVTAKNFGIELMKFIDIFNLIIPEMGDMLSCEQNNPYHEFNVYEHTYHAIRNCGSTDEVVRFAVLFHDIGKPHSYQDGEDGIRHFKGHGKISAAITDDIMKRLRFDNKTRKDVVELVHYHDSTILAGKKYVKRWLNKIGEKQFRRLLEIRKADIKGQKLNYEISRIAEIEKVESIIDEVISEKECFTLKDLVISGADIISSGHSGDKQLGICLNMLLSKVINGEVENNKHSLMALVDEYYNGIKD